MNVQLIRATRHWELINLTELWRYRDLLILIMKRDCFARYQQTILGPLWLIVQPLLVTVTFTFIFGRLAEIPTDGIPAPLFYMTGLLLWTYFSNCYEQISGSLVNNSPLYLKAYIPRLTIPLSHLGSRLPMFFIHLTTLSVLYAYYIWVEGISLRPNLFILLLPVPLILAAALSLGFGLLVAATSIRYRDLLQVNSFFIQLAMYATPIIYPVSRMPEKWKFLIYLNPMAPLIESYRLMLFGRGTFDPAAVGCSLFIMLSILVLGLLSYNRAARTFVDII